jgi:hypothetical protein
MNPAPTLDAACNDIRARIEKAVEFLQYAAQGQGEFVSAVDTHIRLTLALGEIEKALSMMRQRVLPMMVIRP